MKQRPKAQRRTQRAAANLVPSFEECLTFVMDNLSHSRDELKTSSLSAKEKQRFRQMERKADALDLDKYRDTLRRVLAPGLHDMTAESKAHVDVVHDELREFFKRYEILSWQVVPGRATHQQVLWALSHRFFLAWLALRIAFRLRDDADVGTTVAECWFIPFRGGELGSCVMKIIDQFVRRKKESNAHLARRLYDHFPTAKQDAHGLALEDNLSKYTELKSTPSDATIKVVVEANLSIPHLRLMLVLARFIDRCVRAALKVFSKVLLLELLEYFVVCFVHFHSVLKRVRSELPAVEQGNVWLQLQSLTYLGNTPGQRERFNPLMDEFMNELPRRINAEFRRTVRSGDSSHLPRDEIELNAGRWNLPRHVSIPKEIEGAPYQATVSAAVAASRRTFKRRINIAQALRAKQRFEFLGLGTIVAMARGHEGFCNAEEAKMAVEEEKRLLQMICNQSPQRHKLRVTLSFLKFLIEPFRPKSHEEGKLARRLLGSLRQPLFDSNLAGAAEYLDGCLHGLEQNYKLALRSYSNARKLGRESCGEFWIDLLRAGLMTAERVKAKRERENFAKHVRIFGVFSNDATPRTNELKAQMKEDDFRRSWLSAFKPFPTE